MDVDRALLGVIKSYKVQLWLFFVNKAATSRSAGNVQSVRSEAKIKPTPVLNCRTEPHAKLFEVHATCTGIVYRVQSLCRCLGYHVWWLPAQSFPWCELAQQQQEAEVLQFRVSTYHVKMFSCVPYKYRIFIPACPLEICRRLALHDNSCAFQWELLAWFSMLSMLLSACTAAS